MVEEEGEGRGRASHCLLENFSVIENAVVMEGRVRRKGGKEVKSEHSLLRHSTVRGEEK